MTQFMSLSLNDEFLITKGNYRYSLGMILIIYSKVRHGVV